MAMGRSQATIVRAQRGFTIIEILIVVAIVAILAAVVVPSFLREGQRVKADSEVAAMFAEISTKQERYKSENGSYLPMTACPSAPSGTPQDLSTTCLTATDWVALGISPPESKLRCSYSAEAGDAGDNPTVPNAGFSLPSNPATGWYFVLATCDMDGNSSTKSYYLQSSLDAKIQAVGKGL